MDYSLEKQKFIQEKIEDLQCYLVDNPRIGIVMPVYNAEKTLENTIKHIIDQSYKNWRLFVVNDRSTDSSKKILEYFANQDSRIIIMQSDANLGPSEVRNLAINAINDLDSITYIAFCDADDVWLSTKHLEENLSFLIALEGDICYSDVECVFEDGKPAFLWSGDKDNQPARITFYDDMQYDKLLDYNWIYISTVLMRKGLNLKFDKNLDGVEDWDFYLQALEAKYSIYHLNKPHVQYLVKSNGVAGWGTKDKNIKLKEKRQKQPIKLNLGCGDQKLSGYINCDLHYENADMKFDAAKLPFDDNTVDEIAAYHLIEHFNSMQIPKVLKEWHRALKPGGTLIIETPDFYNSCKMFVDADEQTRILLYNHFFAWPWLPGQIHYFLFTSQQLAGTLNELGFENIVTVPPTSIYANSPPPDCLNVNLRSRWKDIYLKMTATKRK